MSILNREGLVIIDAHAHLWEEQRGSVGGLPVYHTQNGISMFLGERRQMMPPYMEDGRNTAERLIANMDYAGVNGAVLTQEYMDGCQDGYYLSVKERYPGRIKICSLYSERQDYSTEGFDGIKVCASRLKDPDLKRLLPLFCDAEQRGMFISIDLADGDSQTRDMEYLIERCPGLRIAIGHFGMVTTKNWQAQIALAKNENVYIESGGLTWLFNSEFYPFKGAVRAIREAIGICGAGKLMWGSDYPRTMTEITYPMSIRFILESDELDDHEKKAFLGENAAAFYGFSGLEPIEPIKNML